MKCLCCENKISLISILGLAPSQWMDYKCSSCSNNIILPWSIFILVPIFILAIFGLFLNIIFYGIVFSHIIIFILLSIVIVILLFIIQVFPLRCNKEKKPFNNTKNTITIIEKNMDKVLFKTIKYMFLFLIFVVIISSIFEMSGKEIDMNIVREIFGVVLIVYAIKIWILQAYIMLFWKPVSATIKEIIIYHRKDYLYKDYDDYEIAYDYQYLVNDLKLTSKNNICDIINYQRYNNLKDAEIKAITLVQKGIVAYYNPKKITQSCILEPIEIKYHFLSFILLFLGILFLGL